MSSLPAHSFGLIAGSMFCFLVSVLFLVKGLIPGWRGLWGWGRSGKYPISLAGHMGISLGFLIFSIGLFSAYHHIMAGVVFISLFAGFLVFIVSGLIDSLRAK